MTSLRPNLVKRIDRLPKPTSVAGAMQPLFEAISNAIHSVQGRFGDKVAALGRIHVTVSTDRKKEDVWATVEDNGSGLNDKNWDAFTTTDTDNKIAIGGKGVGRGRPIKLDDRTVFYCFIVADIVGKLDDWTFSWQRTADGRGRIYQPKDGFRGSIELIGWDALLGDARGRNQAFFDRAGISGKSYFSPD